METRKQNLQKQTRAFQQYRPYTVRTVMVRLYCEGSKSNGSNTDTTCFTLIGGNKLLNVIPRTVQELVLSGKRSFSNSNCVLHLDISGFTSMTEQLMKHGKAGAEILSQILGRILSRSIHEICSRGGLIAQFEGDSIIAIFPDYPQAAAYRAATSLMDYFKQNLDRKTKFGTWKVSASIVLVHGSVEWGIAGRKRLIHYISSCR